MIIKRKAEKTSRSSKVSEIIRKAVGEVLVKNEMPFKFPISVVQVEMNSDLKIAYVYVVTHEELNEHEIILRLNSCKKYIAREVTSLINLKFSPKLVFRNDKTISKISNIERLLESEKVRKDLDRN